MSEKLYQSKSYDKSYIYIFHDRKINQFELNEYNQRGYDNLVCLSHNDQYKYNHTTKYSDKFIEPKSYNIKHKYTPKLDDKLVEHKSYNQTHKYTPKWEDKPVEHKHKGYITTEKPLIKLINNYEIKCVYRINMNNYYKNVNIYNYKK